MSNARISTVLVGICLLSIINCSIALPKPNSRIWNGEEVNSSIPWAGSLRLNNTHICGATIIGSQYVVTAAHCVSKMGTIAYDPKSITIRVGSVNQYAGGSIVAIKNIFIQPSFGNFLHDIALIQLANVLNFNEKIQPIDFAGKDEIIEPDTIVNIAGWGVLKTNTVPYKLQQIQMKVLSEPECENRAGYGYSWSLCLEHNVGEGVCRGDDGAGVIFENKLVGIVSFAFGACGTKYPDVAVRLPYYSDWLNSIINE